MTAGQLFLERFGAAPAVVASAPGRVNLIGEHTDYNGGLVLPFAIDSRATVAASPRRDGRFRVVSAQRPDEPVETGDAPVSGWAGYVVGAAWALSRRGHQVGGFDLAVDSTVPAGAGLSSSAALECAATLAMTAIAGHELAPAELARTAQLAENEYVGVPCGLMDQMAAAACRAGSVLFFDVGADRVTHIPFDPAAHGLAALVVDTRAHHSLADGEYAHRRATCERAAADLGVGTLREITGLTSALTVLTDPVARKRVRHVVTENERVRRTVAALAAGRVAEIGPELLASHVSLRDDFEVSCAELDVAVDVAMAAGAIGARLTGGGFGGSTINLVPVAALDTVTAAVREAFAARGFHQPVFHQVNPAGGARLEPADGGADVSR